jgi:hypothetical protein
MSLIRVQQSSAVTLTRQFSVDEVLTDASGNVTVAVKRLDGATTGIATPTGNATHTTTGTYTWPLSPSPLLDAWTVDWTGTVGGVAVTVRDYVEIVGGFYFGLAQARTELSIKPAVTSAQLAEKRTAVEQECEAICQRAFVPRFMRRRLSGTGTPSLGTAHRYLRTLRAVTVAGVAWSAPDVAAVTLTDDGRLVRPGAAIWPAGSGNIYVEYEYGQDFPPQNIVDASKTRLRSLLSRPSSGVPDRATSFSTPDGGVYRLSTPGRQKTGIPDVDGVYELYYRPHRAVFA